MEANLIKGMHNDALIEERRRLEHTQTFTTLDKVATILCTFTNKRV